MATRIEFAFVAGERVIRLTSRCCRFARRIGILDTPSHLSFVNFPSVVDRYSAMAAVE